VAQRRRKYSSLRLASCIKAWREKAAEHIAREHLGMFCALGIVRAQSSYRKHQASCAQIAGLDARRPLGGGAASSSQAGGYAAGTKNVLFARVSAKRSHAYRRRRIIKAWRENISGRGIFIETSSGVARKPRRIRRHGDKRASHKINGARIVIRLPRHNAHRASAAARASGVK